MHVCLSACLQEEAAEYGIDWLAPTLTSDEECVNVPEIADPLNSQQVCLLQTLVNPLQQCEDYGKSLYIATNQIVREMIDEH